MRAMMLPATVSFDQNPSPLVPVDMAMPEPGKGEVLIEISVCGVCHTELDEIEGRTPPPVLPVVPGHEIVGNVVELGPGCRERTIGERVGIGWIHSSTGRDDENLSEEFRATGRDVDGGYAEFVVVPERYAFPIPADIQRCRSGAVTVCGWRRVSVIAARPYGGRTGTRPDRFRRLRPPGSADGEAPVSRGPGCTCSRGAPQERQFALELGADWAGDTEDAPPSAPHAIIDTTPAWRPVLCGTGSLRPGGRLVINAIRKEIWRQST